MDALCRVCGGQGCYDIYAKIPRFLNNTERRDLWQKPIAQFVTDVTGLAITRNDGLPERICGLCISYLKHAVSFRNRAVETRLSLVSAAFLTTKDPMDEMDRHKKPSLIEEVQMQHVVTATVATNGQGTNTIPKKSVKMERFFDYEEKTFIEDDMTQFEGCEGGIEINHPEVFRERKCQFCMHKFMLEDTYDSHIDNCLFKSLLQFIKDSNYIVSLKDETSISATEFIRRMVFAIQTVYKSIRGLQFPPTFVDYESPPPIKEETITPSPTVGQNFFQLRGTVNTKVYKDNSLSPDKSSAQTKSISSSSYTQSSPSSSVDSEPRRVYCKECDKLFSTISHLDMHIIKEHTRATEYSAELY